MTDKIKIKQSEIDDIYDIQEIDDIPTKEDEKEAILTDEEQEYDTQLHDLLEEPQEDKGEQEK